MKTLVIHPTDATTDFLIPIYEDFMHDADTTIVRDIIPDDELCSLIEANDRIIMLGHGLAWGLFCKTKFIINKNHADLLRGKQLVGIWCHAKLFFEEHNLDGIYTGMMVSEPLEAEFYGVPYTTQEIDESNAKFAFAMKHAVKYWDMHYIKAIYRLDSHVCYYNKARIFLTKTKKEELCLN